VCQQLKKDEERDTASGKTPLHGTSATAFLTGGLQIEQAQCVWTHAIIWSTDTPIDTVSLRNFGASHSSHLSKIHIFRVPDYRGRVPGDRGRAEVPLTAPWATQQKQGGFTIRGLPLASMTSTRVTAAPFSPCSMLEPVTLASRRRPHG
jgi:hypothetical protein